MQSKLILYPLNAATIVLPDVHDDVTGTMVVGDTVTLSFTYPDGTPVPSYTNLPMLDVVGTQGSYGLAIPSTFNLPVGNYILTFVGTGFEQTRQLEVRNR